MHQITQRWRDISIVKKLYFVVGVMAFLIAGELVALGFSMRTLSAVRAFVEAEGSWSKAQKNAVFSLQRYGITKKESDFELFKSSLATTEWDHLARMELMKPVPNVQGATEALKKARVHPDDVGPMIDLLLRFNQVSYLARAIEMWAQGDLMIEDLKEKAERYRQAIHSAQFEKSEALMSEIQLLDQEITKVEDEFSASLGAGSRWVERVVLSLLLLAVISVEGIGLTLAYFTARGLARGLKDLQKSAKEIGSGNFNEPVTVSSRDEIGRLARSLDQTRELLKASYAELEARVKERTQELEAALAYREDFLSIASHELKTPFTAMHLQLQLLERKLKNLPTEIPLPVLELSKGSIERSNRLRALMNELFDLTRMRSGKIEIMHEACDLAKITEEIVEGLRTEAKNKGSSLEFIVAPDFCREISCDTIRMSQVITNLISNAIKYGNGKPIQVRLGAQNSEVILSVIDHGEGIAPLEVTRVFERFERANGDPNITGLGLGLYITKHLVEAHSGKIEVKSTLGQGSTFTVTIPASKPALSAFVQNQAHLPT